MAIGLIGTYKSSMYAHRDSSGYHMGTLVTPDAPVSGTVYGAHLYDKHIDIGGIALTFEKRQGFAGAKIWVQRTVGISDISDMAVNMSGFDSTLDGFIKGYVPDVTTVPVATGISRNASNPTPPKMVSVHHIEFDNEDGSSQWLSLFVLNAQFKDEGGTPAGQASGQNPNPLAYAATIDFSNRLPWGELFSASANVNVNDDKDITFGIIANNRYAMTAYIDDGIATTYKLPFLPSSATVADHYVFSNGVALVPSLIVTTTGIVTIAAGTDQDIVQHLYPIGNTFTASP